MKVAINGFGRIGRLVLRRLIDKENIELTAINDLGDIKTLAHLLKYDSSQGTFDKSVEVKDSSLQIEDTTIKVFSERDPSALPWKDLDIDVVIEATGVFRTRELMQQHIDAGAKKVVLSAPPKSDGVQTIVLGVNDDKIDQNHDFYSNASCTTNCLAPVAKLIHQKWGIKNALMNTTHAYTASQNLQDAPHKDLRRARAAAENLIPTTTGAATATELVYPDIKGRIKAMAIRVPVITGSTIELNFTLENGSPSVDEINAEFLRASKDELSGIIQYNTDPIVSTDIIGSPFSAIFDAPLSMQVGELYKVIAWYDNEAGFSSRLADLTIKIASFY